MRNVSLFNLEDFLGSKEVLKCDFINEHDVISIMKMLGKCVTSLLGKNKLCPIICCAHLFWLKLSETYIQDTIHYRVFSSLSESDILYEHARWYKHNLKCVIPLAKKDKWCIPGYATILFKDKDTCSLNCNIRVRTIIGASIEGKSHPFKRALQAVNKIGFFLMSITCHKGMWLKKCSNLVPDIRKKNLFYEICSWKKHCFLCFQI